MSTKTADDDDEMKPLAVIASLEITTTKKLNHNDTTCCYFCWIPFTTIVELIMKKALSYHRLLLVGLIFILILFLAIIIIETTGTSFQLLLLSSSTVAIVPPPGINNTVVWPSTIVFQSNNESDDFYNDSIWMKVSEKLCPSNGVVPDISLRYVLFDLARKEIGLVQSKDFNTLQKYILKRIYYGTYAGVSLSQFYTADNNNNNNTLQERNVRNNNNKSISILNSIIYMRIWKNGNNQIRSWEEEMYHNGYIKKYYPVIHNFNKALHLASGGSSQQQQPCIVTAIRDPISHFLSGYNEIMLRIDHKFPQDILPSLERNNMNRNTTNKKMLFHIFINRFLNIELHHGMITWWSSGIMRHVYPMSRILPVLYENNVTLTGYVPTLSNLSHTWPKFLGRACNATQQLTEQTIEHLYLYKLSEFYIGAKEVWADGDEYAKALCIIHAFDYSCFGKTLPDGIPKICQQVYTNETFVNAVLQQS